MYKLFFSLCQLISHSASKCNIDVSSLFLKSLIHLFSLDIMLLFFLPQFSGNNYLLLLPCFSPLFFLLIFLLILKYSNILGVVKKEKKRITFNLDPENLFHDHLYYFFKKFSITCSCILQLWILRWKKLQIFISI